MSRSIGSIVVVLTAGLTSTLDAHGGTFIPPAGSVPGGAGYSPGDVVAPTPRSGPSPATGPAPPTRRPRAGRSGPRLPNAPGGPALVTAITPTVDLAALDLSTWDLWWEFNKEPYLRIKTAVNRLGSASGMDGFFLGFGQDVTGPLGSAPTDADVRNVVLPVLLAPLEGEEPGNDLVTACLIGAARAGAPLSDAETLVLQDALRERIASSSQEISETATVALGILARPASAPMLVELMADRGPGRRAVGGRRVPLRTRAFAAYGLGLLGARTENPDVRRYVVHALLDQLRNDETASPDLGVACVLSLGIVRLPCDSGILIDGKKPPRGIASSREAQLIALLQFLRTSKENRVVRSHIPSALGSLIMDSRDQLDPQVTYDVVQDLLDRVRSRRESRELKQACVAALGWIGDGDDDPLDVDIRRLLLRGDTKLDDRHARHLALIALGRVGGRIPAEGDGAGPNQVAVRKHLLEKLARGRTESRWAAIGLGLLERGLAQRGVVPSSSSAQALQSALAEAKSPLDVGAFAISCGLLGTNDAEAELTAQLERTRSDDVRGHVAVALGMVESRGLVGRLHGLLSESAYRPRLLGELGVALVLLGDRSAGSTLLTMLADANSQASQASIARALGRIGDRRTIEPLTKHVRDESRTQGSRAFAAAALGIVADRDELPWNTEISVMANYMAATATLFDGAGSGILNLL